VYKASDGARGSHPVIAREPIQRVPGHRRIGQKSLSDTTSLWYFVEESSEKLRGEAMRKISVLAIAMVAAIGVGLAGSTHATDVRMDFGLMSDRPSGITGSDVLARDGDGQTVDVPDGSIERSRGKPGGKAAAEFESAGGLTVTPAENRADGADRR
jgi:hypothetical protein